MSGREAGKHSRHHSEHYIYMSVAFMSMASPILLSPKKKKVKKIVIPLLKG